VATLFTFRWLAPADGSSLPVLGLWIVALLVSAWVGVKLGKFFGTSLREGDFSVFWEYFGYAMPVLGAATLMILVVVFLPDAGVAPPPWGTIPAAVAAGAASPIAAGLGRALTMVAESSRGRWFGASVAGLMGATASGFTAILLVAPGILKDSSNEYFEQMLAVAVGAALGSALASAWGSFRGLEIES